MVLLALCYLGQQCNHSATAENEASSHQTIKLLTCNCKAIWHQNAKRTKIEHSRKLVHRAPDTRYQ